MSKEVFGEITLSEAIDRLRIVSREGIVLVPHSSSNGFDVYCKEFCEAADTILNFVDRACCILLTK